MIDLSLTDSEWDELVDILVHTHFYKVRCWFEDRSGNMTDDITDYLAGGSVSIDVTQATPTRNPQVDSSNTGRNVAVDLFDPNHDIDLGSAIFLQRLFCADYELWLPLNARWVAIPACRAPIVAANRSGADISLQAIGKSALCTGRTLEPVTLRKGMKTTDAIGYVLHTLSGIAYKDMAIPDLKPTLDHDHHLRVGSVPWIVAGNLCDLIERDMFFDGAGVFHVRVRPDDPLFVFTDDMVISPPTRQETFYDGNFIQVPNVADVMGAHAKVHAVAYADPRSPISKESMAVNGVDYAVVGYFTNPFVVHQDVIEAMAKRTVARSESTALTYSFDAPVLPLFDENDRVGVEVPGLTAQFTLQQFTYPLSVTDSATMSIGSTKRVSFAGVSR